MTRKAVLFVYLLIGLTCATFTYAGSTMTYGVAARSESMQAFTAVADDPSAIYYNPAGLTQIHGTEMDANAAFVLPDLTYINSTNGITSKSQKFAVGPSFFISSDRLKPITFGFGMYAPFPRISDSTINGAVYNLPHSATVLRIDYVPTAAIRLTPCLSVGVGFVASHIRKDSNVLGFDETSAGYGYTGQAGVLLNLTEALKLGVSYRGPMTATLNGYGKYAGISDEFIAQLKFPATLSMGLAWQVNAPLLLSFEYDNEMWSSIYEVKRNYSNPTLNAIANNVLEGRGSDDIRVGMLYKLENHDEVRAGYSFIGEGIPPKNIVPAMPDYNTNILSIGYSHPYKNFRFDLGYEFAHMTILTSNSPYFPGTYKANANSVLLGVGYQL